MSKCSTEAIGTPGKVSEIFALIVLQFLTQSSRRPASRPGESPAVRTPQYKPAPCQDGRNRKDAAVPRPSPSTQQTGHLQRGRRESSEPPVWRNPTGWRTPSPPGGRRDGISRARSSARTPARGTNPAQRRFGVAKVDATSGGDSIELRGDLEDTIQSGNKSKGKGKATSQQKSLMTEGKLAKDKARLKNSKNEDRRGRSSSRSSGIDGSFGTEETPPRQPPVLVAELVSPIRSESGIFVSSPIPTPDPPRSTLSRTVTTPIPENKKLHTSLKFIIDIPRRSQSKFLGRDATAELSRLPRAATLGAPHQSLQSTSPRAQVSDIEL